MDRARLKSIADNQSKGFTLVEAMVAMVIFTLGFSGLYFFFGVAQQVIAESEKRMYLNLMANCTYAASDDHQLWCNDLNTNIGPLNTTPGSVGTAYKWGVVSHCRALVLLIPQDGMTAPL